MQTISPTKCNKKRKKNYKANVIHIWKSKNKQIINWPILGNIYTGRTKNTKHTKAKVVFTRQIKPQVHFLENKD